MTDADKLKAIEKVLMKMLKPTGNGYQYTTDVVASMIVEKIHNETGDTAFAVPAPKKSEKGHTLHFHTYEGNDAYKRIITLVGLTTEDAKFYIDLAAAFEQDPKVFVFGPEPTEDELVEYVDKVIADHPNVSAAVKKQWAIGHNGFDQRYYKYYDLLERLVLGEPVEEDEPGYLRRISKCELML